MAVIYGTVPPANVLAAFEASNVQVVRWADIYMADNVTLWMSQVAVLDGVVTVDMNRDERRNLDITFNDSDRAIGYGPGQLWYDKIIKPYRGVILPDVQEVGYLRTINLTGNQGKITRSALAAGMTYLEFGCRVQLDQVGISNTLMGWAATASFPTQLLLNSANQLIVAIGNSADTATIGGAVSSIGVPGLTPGTKVWLKGKVQISNAQCTYAYSYDNVNDVDQVNWLALGTVVTGTNAAATPTTAKSTQINFGIGTNGVGFNGRMYAAAEWDSSLENIKINFGGQVASSATITALTGQTVTIASTAIADPARVIAPSMIPGDIWVTCLGEFIPDKIERPRFPRNIHLTGRDFVKKCLFVKFTATTAFPVGQNVGTLIQTLATNAGIAKFNFPAISNVLTSLVTFDRNLERWKAMKQLADSIGYELFFDNYGYLTLRPYIDPLTASLAYTFKTGALGNLVDFSKATTDAFMFNHICVYGDGPDNPLVFGEATNTTVSSPTSIANIGDRVNNIASSLIQTNADAASLALKILKVSGLEQFEMKQSTIVLPWLEAGSAVEVLVDDSVASDPTRYLFTDFRIPFALVPMDGTSRRVTIVG